MNSIKSIIILIAISYCFKLHGNELTTQIEAKYPIDTILTKKDIGIVKRLYILPLKFWQMKSYNDYNLNCQFYPSCSNYCATSIYKEGFIIGSIKGMDRYFRCNDVSQKKYTILSKNNDEYEYTRILDSYNNNYINHLKTKNMNFGLMLSIFPGLSRLYLENYNAGINSFKYSVSSAISTYFLYSINKIHLMYITSYATFIFWSTDIYNMINMKKIITHHKQNSPKIN